MHLSENLDTFDNTYMWEMCGIKPKIENIKFAVQITMPEVNVNLPAFAWNDMQNMRTTQKILHCLIKVIKYYSEHNLWISWWVTPRCDSLRSWNRVPGEKLNRTWHCLLAAQKVNHLLGCTKRGLAIRSRKGILPHLLHSCWTPPKVLQPSLGFPT